jgi:tetratricopeptide (TPR) repeat protein
MVRRSVRGSVFVLALVLLLPASWASGAPTQSRERVVELVTQSQEHYEAGRFQRAIELLTEAYQIEESATILYNLARAYEGLGDSHGALDAYRKYIEQDPKAADRGAIERRIASLEQQLEEKSALERERDAAAQRAAQARRDAERAERDRPPPRPAERDPSIVPWIVAGIGAAMVGGGVYFGLRARSRHEEAENASLARDSANLNDEAKTFALIANVSFIAGGALAVGGVSWGIVDASSGGEQAVVTLSGTF